MSRSSMPAASAPQARSAISTAALGLSLAVALTLSIVAVRPTFAQTPVDPSYNSTIFLPRLGASSSTWSDENTIGRLGQRVYLGSMVYPLDPGTDQAIATQVNNLLGASLPVPGAADRKSVLVGQSMGGLVARAFALADAGRTAGIFTIGSPHGGAIIADNGQTAAAYFREVIAQVSAGLTASTFGVGPAANMYVLINEVFGSQIENALLSKFDIATPAANDLKTTSPTVQNLNSTTDQFSHAQIYGDIDTRLAWLRVAASSSGDESKYGIYSLAYYLTSAGLYGCGYVNIFRWPDPRRAVYCRVGYKAVTSIDERWQYFTTGVAGSGIGRIIRVGSDGFIPHSRSAYPGTTLSGDPVTNRRVPGANHINLITLDAGISILADAMLARQMLAP